MYSLSVQCMLQENNNFKYAIGIGIVGVVVVLKVVVVVVLGKKHTSVSSSYKQNISIY